MLLKLDALVDQYNRDHELEELAKDAVKAVMLRSLPEPIRTHLRLVAGSHDYTSLPALVDEFVRSTGAFWNQSVSKPLESDVIVAKGKSKGNVKAKGS